MLRHGFGLCALFLAACSSEASSESSPTQEVTFYDDVAPILYENCVSCHHPDSITPFSLIDYASAKQVAPNIAAATAAREMPPMPVDNSGSCNTYSNARWLSDDEIHVLQRWADGGAKEGDPAHAPAVPEAPAGLDQPNVVLDPGVTYQPNGALDDDYHCFVLPSPVEDTSFVTQYEIIPGDQRVVHHVIVYQPADDAEADKLEGIDRAEDGDGYTCFGGPGVNADPLVLWAPGGGVVTLPSGTGTPLWGKRKLVMQVHYNLLGGSYPDYTTAKLKTVSSGVTPAKYLGLADLDMKLEPGKASAETSTDIDSGSRPFTVYGVLPHMHTLGRTLRVDVDADGQSSCLVNVDRWDFHWQNAWWYDTPKSFSSVQSATIRCGYDTTSRSEMVTWVRAHKTKCA